MRWRREKKSVVVAIRGTQSIADLVTDAVVHPEPMESWVPQACLAFVVLVID